MSHSDPPLASSSNFQLIINNALDSYKLLNTRSLVTVLLDCLGPAWAFDLFKFVPGGSLDFKFTASGRDILHAEEVVLNEKGVAGRMARCAPPHILNVDLPLANQTLYK